MKLEPFLRLQSLPTISTVRPEYSVIQRHPVVTFVDT